MRLIPDSFGSLDYWRAGAQMSGQLAKQSPEPGPTQSRATAEHGGNFPTVTTDGTPQSRVHNGHNQLIQVGSETLTSDAAGNMTTDERGQTLVYDSWNRLVGQSTNFYRLDALGRRSRVLHTTADGWTSIRNLYYTTNWQLIEERGIQFSVEVLQYVWSA